MILELLLLQHLVRCGQWVCSLPHHSLHLSLITLIVLCVTTDESNAVQYGQRELRVTHSRGYKREDLIANGYFESLARSSDDDFHYETTDASDSWIRVSSPIGDALDSTFFLCPRR